MEEEVFCLHCEVLRLAVADLEEGQSLEDVILHVLEFGLSLGQEALPISLN